MARKVIIKENGDSIYSERLKLVSDSSYLKGVENCFDSYFLSDFSKDLKDDIFNIKRAIDIMLSEIIKEENGKEQLKCLYNSIKSVQSKDDLVAVFNKFNDLYEKIINNKINKEIRRKDQTIPDDIRIKKHFFERIRRNEDALLSILTKSIIKLYYSKIISSLEVNEINRLEKMKMERVSYDELFEYIGEKFDDISINNGTKNLSTRILLTEIDNTFDQKQKNLCWESCENATAQLCPKVRDRVKRPINQYSFIKSGIQIFDKKGVLDTFLVDECDNYKKEEPKKYSAEELKHIKKIKEGLRLAYFDATSLEESEKKEAQLIKKGFITPAWERK